MEHGKEELYHHGILGMKWGVRRYQNKDGTLTPAGKRHKAETEKKDQNEQTQTSTIKSMTDAELREKIARLELEKKYSDLIKNAAPAPKSNSKIKKLIEDVLTDSTKNIATQAATYGMGTLINKVFKEEIVNPKKGQKDK